MAFGAARWRHQDGAKSRRTLALPQAAVQALREHRKRQAEDRLAAGALGEAGRWLEGYQAFFEESYERLEEHLAGPEERSRPTPDRSKSNERGRGTP